MQVLVGSGNCKNYKTFTQEFTLNTLLCIYFALPDYGDVHEVFSVKVRRVSYINSCSELQVPCTSYSISTQNILKFNCAISAGKPL